MKKLLIVSFILIPIFLFAQRGENGNWLMYFGANKISDNFSIHTEIQYRNHTVVPGNTEQLLLRTGLNYHYSKNAMFTAGYAFIPSYVFDSDQKEPESTEDRIWQQFILKNKVGLVYFEHRYRLEQRWVNDLYKNRFRYRIMLSVPLNNSEIKPGTMFLALYDEIFINGKDVFYDRNRLYGALGYQINNAAQVQLGILNQKLNANDKWYLQMALIYNPDLRRKAN